MKKVNNRKGDKLYVKWKSCDSLFNSCIDKKDIVWLKEYFWQWKSLGGRVKVELDLSNNATKTYLKNEMGVNTPSLAEYVDLAN